MEKGIKKIWLRDLKSEIIEVEESVDFYIYGLTSELVDSDKPEARKLILQFQSSDIKSDVSLNIIADSSKEVDLEIVVRIPEGFGDIQSELDMRCLMLDPSAKVKFVPSLEIRSKDVSVDHRSTIGVLPAKWRQYLQERGLTQNDYIKLFSHEFSKYQ